MHGLDEMTRTARAHKGCAGLAFVLGGNGVEDMRYPVPVRPVAAAHDRGSVSRAVLAARDPDAEIGHTGGGGLGGAAIRIVIVRIARIDNQVVRIHQRAQGRYLRIHGLARGHHQDNCARRGDRVDEFFQRTGRSDLRCQRPGLFHEAVHTRDGTVEYRNRKSFFGNVERQHRTHGAETDQSDFRRAHGCWVPCRFRETR